MTSSLPRLPDDIAQLLSVKRPDSATWRQLCRSLDVAEHIDYVAVKKALASWPRELPRPRPTNWNDALYNQRLALCIDFDEPDTYPLYIDGVAKSHLLRLRDGSPAVTLWRQPRGVVELANGTRMAFNDDQPGMADLGAIIVVELACAYCRGRRWEAQGFDSCSHLQAPRIQLYGEVEVKLDGKLPPGCREYRGDSIRVLTKTEQDQVQRQRAQLQRGGCYIFAERVQEAVEALAKFRDDVVGRIS